MAFISGAFTATFNAASIGATEDGFHVVETPHIQAIHTDEFGDGTVDAVHRGSDTEVRFTYVEYELVKAALYATHPQGQPKTNVGKLMSALAMPLVLTPVAGTPAAVASGAYTFYLCFVSSDIEQLLQAGLKKGPCTFKALPSSGNSNKTFVVASPS